MINEQILKKVVEKAVENGYDISKYPSAGDTLHYIEQEVDLTIKDYYFIIFSHDFVKAFWGEEEVDMAIIYPKANKELTLELKHFKSIRKWKKWEYYLMMMVKEKEPLKYLEQFIN